MRRLPTLVLAVLFLLAAAVPCSRAQACPSGYESRARLVKGAHHLVEVEVLSVSDEPAPAKPREGFFGGDSPEERKDSHARVRVVGDARGHLPVREFTLVGGPYASCAPYPVFLNFKVGERLFLILADEVPPGTEEIRVLWRCRAFRGSGAELAAIVGAATSAWQRRLSILRRVAPKAMEGAATLVASRGADGDWPLETLRPLPYAVLAGAAVLLSDPTRPWRAQDDARGPAAPPSSDYAADSDPLTPLPPHLAAEIARRREKGVAEGAEMVAFHREVLKALLVTEMGQPAARAERFAADVPVTDLLREVLPLDGFRIAHGEDRELSSVNLLLELASDEDDALVWTMGVASSQVDPAVFAPWLKDHAKDLPTTWTHLQVTLALRSPEAASNVNRAFAELEGTWRLDEFLAFFVAVGDQDRSDEAMKRLSRVVDEATVPGATAEDAASARRTIESARKTVGEVGAAGKACLARLDALLARLPPK